MLLTRMSNSLPGKALSLLIFCILYLFVQERLLVYGKGEDTQILYVLYDCGSTEFCCAFNYRLNIALQLCFHGAVHCFISLALYACVLLCDCTLYMHCCMSTALVYCALFCMCL